MKKSFFFLLGATILLISSGSALLSRTFVWDHYKLQVTVPDDFVVAKNTDEEFEMTGEGMVLVMEIFEQSITIDELDDAVKQGAAALKLEAVDDEHELDFNGLEGYYVEGILKGNRVMFAGLMDPYSNTNFFISLTFDDEDKNAEASALRILSSIKHTK
jgi:hypothetical protein